MSEERKSSPPPKPQQPPPPPDAPTNPIEAVLGGEGIRGEVLGCPTGCVHPLAEAMARNKSARGDDDRKSE